MSISPKTAVVFSCFTFVISGCGLTVDVNDENFCEEYAKVACHNMFRCCSGAIIEGILGTQQTQTEQDCRRDMDLICQDRLSDTLASIKADRISVDTGNAKACLEAMIAPDDECFVFTSDTTLDDSCGQPIFVGQQAAGEACVLRDDCADPNLCNDDMTCEAPANTECQFVGCDHGFYCDGDNVCQEKKDNGSPCTSRTECKSGDCDEECVPVYREIDYCQVVEFRID